MIEREFMNQPSVGYYKMIKIINRILIVNCNSIAITFIGWKIGFLAHRLTRDFILLEGGSPRPRKFLELV